MSVTFVIEYVAANSRNDRYIIARLLKPEANFTINENSLFNGIQIKTGLYNARANNPDGTPRSDLFIFYPKYKKDIELFKKDMLVELTTKQ